MNTGRFVAPGRTRSCPHCKATILESATVCPACHHHLRFDSVSPGQRPQPTLTPLRVEGTLRHPANGGTWEYSVVLTIRNARGQEVARQVVGVGALQPAEERTFTLAVEVFKPAEVHEPKPQAASPPPRAPDPRVSPRPQAPPTLPGPGREAPRPSVAGPAATRGSLPPLKADPAPPSRNAGLKDPRIPGGDPKPQSKRP